MTKWDAVKHLEGIMNTWIDFEYWAYLQLEMRGEWSNERMHAVLENHERAWQRMNKFKEEIRNEVTRMIAAGSTAEEANRYSMSRADERAKLVAAWRSLDGVPQ